MPNPARRVLPPLAVAASLPHTLTFRLVALSLALAGAGSLSSQPPPADQEEAEEPTALPPVEESIVVSANRLEVAAERVGSSVTVIEAGEIERRGKLTVTDLLRTVPGLELTQTGGPGKVTSLRIRGGDASHTLVLIDGLRSNSTTTGDFDFGHLKADNIERIEVLRGPQAIYGSEAVSGVISIVTRRGGEELEARLSAEAGSHRLRHLRLTAGGSLGAFDYSVSAADLSTEGVSARSQVGPGGDLDGYDNRTAAGRFGYGFGGGGRAELTLRWSDGDSQVDGFFGDDPNASQLTETLQTGLMVSQDLAPFWRQSIRLGVADTRLLGSDPDSPFNNFDIDSRISQLHLQSDVTLSTADTLIFGYDQERREGRNVGSFDEKVDLRSAYLQNLWSHDERLFLTAGVRYDDHSQFGDETTYRLTVASLLPGGATRLHATFGTSFRAPDFNELYFPFAGDPSLGPERSRGFDLGIEPSFLGRRLRLDLTYFDTDFDDLIVFDLEGLAFSNLGEARSRGLETSLDFAVTRRCAFVLTHTYSETEDRSTGEALPRRPRNRSTAVLDLDPHERLQATLMAFVVRDRIGTSGVPMDDYTRVDLTLDSRFAKRWRPYLRVENLFDEDYEEVPGFTTPGRTAAVGLAVEL